MSEFRANGQAGFIIPPEVLAEKARRTISPLERTVEINTTAVGSPPSERTALFSAMYPGIESCFLPAEEDAKVGT